MTDILSVTAQRRRSRYNDRRTNAVKRSRNMKENTNVKEAGNVTEKAATRKKKLLVCDVEGTIFEASYKIPGTDYASTMWQPLADGLDRYNKERGIEYPTTTVEDERLSNVEWKKEDGGKYGKVYLRWVDDTVRIHQEHGMCREVFENVLASAKYNKGVVEFFRQLDSMDSRFEYIPVFISGGFVELIEKAQTGLLDSNGKTIIRHGFGACKYIWDEKGNMAAWTLQPSDFQHKYSFLKIIMQQYGLSETDDWIFVGDGENDADIASRAPISFAINPQVKLAAVATYTIDSFNDIPELLKTDEISRYISTKRGLSNTQAISVGQRLMNSCEVAPRSYKEFELDGGTLKYRLDARLENAHDGKGDVFDETISAIIDWAKLYAENDEHYASTFGKNTAKDYYNFHYSGAAVISCSYIACGGERKWGFKISAPDLGTAFRQPIFGACVDFNILLTTSRGNGIADLKLRVSIRMPSNSYVKQHKISTEAYCPKFLRQLANSNVCIKTDEGLRLCANVENLSSKAILPIEKISLPVILAEKSKDDFPQLVANHLFGFAKVYVADKAQLRQYCHSDDAKMVIVFPQSFKIEPKEYTEASFDDPSDSISYDTTENHHVVYSKSNGTKREAMLINITDYVIDKCKEAVKNELLDNCKYYDQVLQAVENSE